MLCGHAQLHMNPVTLTCGEGRGSLLRSGLGIIHAGTCKGACVQARSWGYPSLPYLRRSSDEETFMGEAAFIAVGR